ncbi:nuclear transcription factor Y subunit B-3-like [Malus sylvestris]|uniref:nuclear transcription factor Y subunit B-3-like n=1 Tax=Malus sylvestris TaxID=3752 RepID=UPI0021ACE0AE|nr:nuclear transcription factor Y subunit B-3-like [Malus sylvestris]
MERMGGGLPPRHAKSSNPANSNSSDGGNAIASTSNPANPAGNSDNNTVQRAPQCLVREQDRYMPIANVIRIMRRILPPHAKISDDAKETMQECVSEYIAFITGEANERCQREQRKTVTAEDVLWAMGKLGFDNYVEPLTIYLQRYRESESSDRSQFVKREERQSMDYCPPGHAGPQVAMMPPPPPSYGPGYYFGPQHGPPMYDPSMMGMFRDGSSSGAGGGGSSSASGAQGENSLGGFNPFGHFK